MGDIRGKTLGGAEVVHHGALWGEEHSKQRAASMERPVWRTTQSPVWLKG